MTNVNTVNYQVFVYIDQMQRILDINSSLFLDDISGWTIIDSGEGNKFARAKNEYLPGPLYTEDGIPRYKMVDGKPVERTEAEIEDDRAAIPAPPPTDRDVLDALLGVSANG